MKLVTVEQARMRLRIDDDFDNDDLELMIEGASAAVITYLKSAVNKWIADGKLILDAEGKPLLPPQVLQAVLVLVGIFYKDRDEDPEGLYEMGYLPKPVTALLYPLRDPAIA
ncbi:head-tail connector protein [Xanthomonas translucens pv. translucens]|uniref:head-tail connector protein n=1 Tax=Xanthomonas campestris pv. translucens TaxID=343 RepID=UPI003F72C0C7